MKQPNKEVGARPTRDRRKFVRRLTLKGGRLAYDCGSQTTDCLIRDLSEGGARIQVADVHCIPSELLLSFDDGRGSRSCFVRWRRGNALGIEFTDAKKGLASL
jgi:PilZ domain